MQMSSVKEEEEEEKEGGRWGDAAQESAGERVEPFGTVWVCGGWQKVSLTC